MQKDKGSKINFNFYLKSTDRNFILWLQYHWNRTNEIRQKVRQLQNDQTNILHLKSFCSFGLSPFNLFSNWCFTLWVQGCGCSHNNVKQRSHKNFQIEMMIHAHTRKNKWIVLWLTSEIFGIAIYSIQSLWSSMRELTRH